MGDDRPELLGGVAGHAVETARAIGRPDERIAVERLVEARSVAADMATIVVIGATATRLIDRGGGTLPFVYTPRVIGTRC